MTHDPNDPEILKATLAQAMDERDQALRRIAELEGPFKTTQPWDIKACPQCGYPFQPEIPSNPSDQSK